MNDLMILASIPLAGILIAIFLKFILICQSAREEEMLERQRVSVKKE